MGETINTRYGALDVTIQDGRTAYVRAGTGDRDDSTGDRRLELPRGVSVHGRGHFKFGGTVLEGWKPVRGFSHFKRDRWSDLTTKQEETLHEAICGALLAITDERLSDAQYTRNQEEAAKRRAQAAALCEMANQLNRQATELEMDRGARVVYVNQRLSSGADQDAIAVRTGAGELLFVDEPRDSVNENGLRRYLGEEAPWTERD